MRLSYAIGRPDPTSVSFTHFGTAHASEDEIDAFVRDHPLRPLDIIEYLDLRRPIYVPTSYHGHFGRTPGDDGTFTWEDTGRRGG